MLVTIAFYQHRWQFYRMKFDTYTTLSFARRGRILEITMDRPATLNAVDEVMHEELARVFTDASNDADSDIVVLTGAGRAFSSGGDVVFFQKMIDEPASFEKTAREAKQIIFSLLDCEKPVIAKLNGHATGLGATIALFCDIVFAADSAKIGDPHVSVGLMTGTLMTATQAAGMGLINHVVPLAELDVRVGQFADTLAAGAIKAIKWTKLSVNIGLKQLASSIMDASLAYEAMSNVTADHQEAVNAFREKRKPVFVGR